ncbi:MAG: hypothetical protein HC835_07690 [Oscillatoriales cyanobacterium RM2_1_1]|nr:hypothetical protein [Oscillatoriales cyanobacterium SM2_3_0]NJO45513.1 hypothetical protein [Oscillatoriales cyanobacterium RM2_1_1]
MAYFYSVRGWLEVEPEQFERLIAVVQWIQSDQSQSSEKALYAAGWCWQTTLINWRCYVFYGAEMQGSGLVFFQEMLDWAIAANLNLSGYFHARGEDGCRNQAYRITQDHLQIIKLEGLIPENP